MSDIEFIGVLTLKHLQTSGKFYEIAVFKIGVEYFVVRRYGAANKFDAGGAIEYDSFASELTAKRHSVTVHGKKKRSGYEAVTDSPFFPKNGNPNDVLTFYSACTGTNAVNFQKRLGDFFGNLVNQIVEDVERKRPKPEPARPAIEGWGAW